MPLDERDDGDGSSAELMRGLSTMLSPSFPRHARAGHQMDLEQIADSSAAGEGASMDSAVTEPEDGLRQLRLSMVPPFLDWSVKERPSLLLQHREHTVPLSRHAPVSKEPDTCTASAQGTERTVQPCAVVRGRDQLVPGRGRDDPLHHGGRRAPPTRARTHRTCVCCG